VRIESRPGSGARYFIRAAGTPDPYALLYDSPNYADARFGFGADVYAGTFGFDDVALDGGCIESPEFSAPVYPGGTVALVVEDDASQTGRTETAIQSVRGSPPAAVMTLPPGLDKAAGLRAALDRLDVAPRRAIGIGDAENDEPLLAVCGLGVAVANATPALKEQADLVTHGERGRGVAEVIDRFFTADRPI